MSFVVNWAIKRNGMGQGWWWQIDSIRRQRYVPGVATSRKSYSYPPAFIIASDVAW
jgi:hypothetical protein